MAMAMALAQPTVTMMSVTNDNVDNDGADNGNDNCNYR